MKRLLRSFGHGFRGLFAVAKSEQNMAIHLVASVVALGLAWHFRLTPIEWCLIIACCGAVLALECMNTAIERLADRVSTEQDPLIGKCKDAAAAAVLVAASVALVIGGIIFLPRIWNLLS